MKRIAVWILLCILLCPLMQVQAEDITDLTIETVTFDNGNPGLSAVEEAVNQITIPAIGVRIHLLDVEELAPAVRTVTASRIGGGLHLLRRQREQLSLRVRFLIEEYDIAARHQLLHLVAAWAEAGGVLTLHEDGKRVLRVVCTQFPAMSTLNWLETLSLVFTAFSCPYWEDAAETSFLMPNTSDAPSKLLAVPGDAPETPLNLLIRNIGDTAITTLTISAAGKISFQGLTLAPGAAIRIHHNAGVFAAEMVSDDSTVSILPYRTPDSADDLLLRPGVLNEIRVEAGSAAFVSGRCKGRYC